MLIPLAMLSATGAWISFPSVFGAFESGPPRGPGGPGGGGGPAQPLVETQTPVDAAVAAATPLATGPLLSIGWPTDRSAEWTIQFETDGSPAEVKVADADATALPPEPPQPETLARTMRRWHDGTEMGAALADRDLPRRDHPRAAFGHRHHYLVAGAQSAAAGAGGAGSGGDLGQEITHGREGFDRSQT